MDKHAVFGRASAFSDSFTLLYINVLISVSNCNQSTLDISNCAYSTANAVFLGRTLRHLDQQMPLALRVPCQLPQNTHANPPHELHADACTVV